MRKENLLYAVAVVIFGAVPYVNGQYYRGESARPSNNIKAFHGSLGSSSLGYFRSEAPKFRFNRQASNAPLYMNLSKTGGARNPRTRGRGLTFSNPLLSASSMQPVGLGDNFKMGQISDLYASSPDVPPMDVNIPFAGGMNTIVLLPSQADFCQRNKLACELAAEAAVKPVVGDALQRPNLNAPKPKGYFPPAVDYLKDDDRVSSTTYQSTLYVAQQISRARQYIRKRQYEQALTCYRAASGMDAKNVSSLVGSIYSIIMCGKFQAGGLLVLKLSGIDQNFWTKPPDFIAIFGESKNVIVTNGLNAEPDIDYYINLCRAENSKYAKEGMKLAYLSKMFLAWLSGNKTEMIRHITSAAKIAKYDPKVQRIYRKITGKEELRQLNLKPMKAVQ